MSLYSIPPLLSLICFAFLAVLAIMRKQKHTVNILFCLLCLIGIMIHIDILILFSTNNPRIALWSSRIDHVFIVYAIPLFIHFFHAYLNITRRRWLIYTGYAGAFVLMWFSLTPYCIEKINLYRFGYYGSGGRLYPLIGFGAGVACIYSLTILMSAIHREQSSIRKNKLKYIMMGFGVMGILIGLNVLPLLGYPIYPPGTFSFIPLLVLAVGLFRYDLLDMGIVVQKSLLYSILTILLTCLFATVVTVSNHFLQQNIFMDTLYLQMIFFLVVVIVFGPIQSRVQRIISPYFHREATALKKSMGRVSHRLAVAMDDNTINQTLLNALVDNLKVCHASLYLRDASGDDFRRASSKSLIRQTYPHALIPGTDHLVKRLRHLDRPVTRHFLMERKKEKDNAQCLFDMDKLWAEVVFPMTIKQDFTGFVVLGQKKSRTLFNREELNLVTTLVVQVSLALENARTYQQLTRLNNHLEVKVQERTTALKKALAEVKESQEFLIRSESLAAIGQLVAGVAHELNNPISAAMSLMQSIQTDFESYDNPDRETVRNDIVFSLKALGRVKRIVASLLCLSRQTDSYTESVDINDVAMDALRVLDGYIKRADIQIEKDFEWPIPSIQGNFAHLGQVAINIIQNACQAMAGQRGHVVLSTRYRQTTNNVVFSCQDNGSGINPSIQKDIYKPFFTTKPVGQGTGLGLYISHEIVQKHHGRIRHINSADGGALFEVILPVID